LPRALSASLSSYSTFSLQLPLDLYCTLLDFEARILAARFNRWVQGGEEMIEEGEGGLIIVVTTHNSLGHQRRGGAELQKQQAEKKLRKNKNKIKSKNRRGGPGLWGVCANHLETISAPVRGG